MKFYTSENSCTIRQSVSVRLFSPIEQRTTAGHRQLEIRAAENDSKWGYVSKKKKTKQKRLQTNSDSQWRRQSKFVKTYSDDSEVINPWKFENVYEQRPTAVIIARLTGVMMKRLLTANNIEFPVRATVAELLALYNTVPVEVRDVFEQENDVRAEPNELPQADLAQENLQVDEGDGNPGIA